MAFSVTPDDYTVYRVKHYCIGIILPPFVRREMPVPFKHVPVKKCRSLGGVYNILLYHIDLGGLVHVNPGGNLSFESFRETVISHQCGCVATTTAYHLDVPTVVSKVFILVIGHNSLLNHPSGFHSQYVVKVLHVFVIFAA